MTPFDWYLCALAAVLCAALGVSLRQRWVAGAPLRRLRAFSAEMDRDDQQPTASLSGIDLTRYLEDE